MRRVRQSALSMILILWAAAMGVCIAAAQAPSENLIFLPAVTYDSGGEDAFSIAVADVNGDSKPDLLVANWWGYNRPGSAGVLLGNGDGTFQPVHIYDTGAPFAASMAVADVNGDGKPDLLVANEVSAQDNVEGVVGVLLGNGDGTFQPAVTYDSGGRGARSIALADVNHDDQVDVLVANSNRIGVLLGNGDGTFQSPQGYTSAGYTLASIAISDVNSDTNPDLLVATRNDVIFLLLGNGDGTFQSPLTYPSGGRGPHFVTAADLNGDHKPDVVVADYDSSTVQILVGNGDGTFQPAVGYAAGGANASSAAVADVNGDGKPDLLVTNGCEVSPCAGGFGLLGVLLGNGDATFQSAQTYLSGGMGAWAVAAADVNNDARPDAIVANLFLCDNHYCYSGAIGVLLNDNGPHTHTSTTIASSLNPSSFGQVVPFTATVTSSEGSPTGTVAFVEGENTLGTATLVAGSATFSTSGVGAGPHAIYAKYLGSDEFDQSTSAPLTQVVNPATTRTVLTAFPNPARVNESVTYTASVTSQYGGWVSGYIQFQDGGTNLATVFLSNNRAAFTTSYNTFGTHIITALYLPDANNVGSRSDALTETVVARTTTLLTTSESPVFVGQTVTFTANVTSRSGSIPNGELVVFYDGRTAMASVPLAGGKASYSTSALAGRSHTIRATYSGDANFLPSYDGLKQVIHKYPTVTTLVSAPNPSMAGQAVNFTVQVAGAGPNTPTGYLKLLDGTTTLGWAPLSGGAAVFTRSTLAVGTHSITARYSGDDNSTQSTSAPVNQVVQ